MTDYEHIIGSLTRDETQGLFERLATELSSDQMLEGIFNIVEASPSWIREEVIAMLMQEEDL